MDPARSVSKKKMGILIICPTRELATQTYNESKVLANKYNLGVIKLIGGENIKPQYADILKLRHDIIVGTPGQILKTIEINHFFTQSIKHLKALVLDEADMLLNTELKETVNAIISFCPEDRANYLVSATFSDEMIEISKNVFGENKVSVIDATSGDDSQMVEKIDHSYMLIDWDMHFPTIYHILLSSIKKHLQGNRKGSKYIIFVPTSKTAEIYSSVLRSLLTKQYVSKKKSKNKNLPDDIEVYCIHGKMPQEDRNKVFGQFRNFNHDNNRSAVIVTTDVSSRGLDYPDVKLVLQIGVPTNTEQYLHRVGRTGRAGKNGDSILFISPFEKKFIEKVEDFIGKTMNKNTQFTSELISKQRSLLKKLESFPANEPENLDNNHENGLDSSENQEVEKYMKMYVYKKARIHDTIALNNFNEMYFSLLSYYAGLNEAMKFNPDKILLSINKTGKFFDFEQPRILAPYLSSFFSI
ncbi:hypothetical protein BB558_004936 [Smittium angustum]|uniref:ATP-dependent RNA helicase n=1 Tax=Smittium angustum TaxID=133377 RepID=A0A2U1J1X6_SMIAN|nr:hypothetical protein BB558_004936 [Smittium angustum]